MRMPVARRASGERSSRVCSGKEAASGPPGEVHSERKSLDALGGGDRHLLGHHPAEAHADDREGVPPHVVGQGEGVGGVVGHRVRPGWDLGAAQSPLVGGDHVGRFGERLHQQAGGGQRGARPVEEQQRAPVALALEVDVDAVEMRGGHGVTLTRPELAHPIRMAHHDDLIASAPLKVATQKPHQLPVVHVKVAAAVPVADTIWSAVKSAAYKGMGPSCALPWVCRVNVDAAFRNGPLGGPPRGPQLVGLRGRGRGSRTEGCGGGDDGGVRRHLIEHGRLGEAAILEERGGLAARRYPARECHRRLAARRHPVEDVRGLEQDGGDEA